MDLLRSDLGRVARTGSVRVPRLFHVEAYPTLFQMTSDVRAQLAPGLALRDVLAALFPCGSVTGAPKVGTMPCLAPGFPPPFSHIPPRHRRVAVPCHRRLPPAFSSWRGRSFLLL